MTRLAPARFTLPSNRPKIAMSATESAFETLAAQKLEHLAEAIDSAIGDQFDVDLNQGILTIDLETGGQYVINKHGASRQIWVSSPVSGASHFSPAENGRWTATNGLGTLEEILSDELSSIAGEPVELA